MLDLPLFSGGLNIAMKLPERHFQQTLEFYRDVLCMPVKENETGALVQFGSIRLHLDRLAHQSQTDLWLEIATPDTTAARDRLARFGITPCDEVEQLPGNFDGFWIAAPSGTIHLVATKTENDPA